LRGGGFWWFSEGSPFLCLFRRDFSFWRLVSWSTCVGSVKCLVFRSWFEALRSVATFFQRDFPSLFRRPSTADTVDVSFRLVFPYCLILSTMYVPQFTRPPWRRTARALGFTRNVFPIRHSPAVCMSVGQPLDFLLHDGGVLRFLS